MAQLIGEQEFSQLYHKGKKASLHFCKVNSDLLLINVSDNKISLGLLRLKSKDVTQKINRVCKRDKDGDGTQLMQSSG